MLSRWNEKLFSCEIFLNVMVKRDGIKQQISIFIFDYWNPYVFSTMYEL